MNLIIFLCFILAAGCFGAAALNVQTKTPLMPIGLLALTVGLAGALRVWAW